MKIRRLPEIDLARIAPLATERKRGALEIFRLGHPTITYKPVRALFAGIFNVKLDLLTATDPIAWPTLDRLIRAKATSNDERDANLLVAKGLYEFASANAMGSRYQDFFSLSLSVGEKVEYWLPMVTALDGAPLIVFIDPRRGKRLTADARRFVFSMMHEHIRLANPDFSEARLGILQFGDVVEDQRPAKLWTDAGIALYGFDELDQMVRETYDIWREVSEARESETRRKSAGGYGPLFE
ncbi:type VI toxin-antitoxin system SocB family DNA replication inhibitor toxin [Neorhizobium sp. DT-125]|uniref:type VI toxin-antitoxin system SocB family DNA replication inhibitor toxin n=1 Tax=Neorhizobium sp. DT-125 TaxID=3396163 RepID=UPI003F1A1DBD